MGKAATEILESIKEQLLLLITLCRQEIFKVKSKGAMAPETGSGNHRYLQNWMEEKSLQRTLEYNSQYST